MDASSEGILGADQPLGECETVGRTILWQRREDRGNARLHLAAEFAEVAPQLHVRLALLRGRKFAHH